MSIKDLDDSQITQSSLLKIMSCEDPNLLQQTIGEIDITTSLILQKLAVIFVGYKTGMLSEKAVKIASDQQFIRGLLSGVVDFERLKVLLKTEIDTRFVKTDENLLEVDALPYDRLKHLYLELKNKSHKYSNSETKKETDQIFDRIYKINDDLQHKHEESVKIQSKVVDEFNKYINNKSKLEKMYNIDYDINKQSKYEQLNLITVNDQDMERGDEFSLSPLGLMFYNIETSTISECTEINPNLEYIRFIPDGEDGEEFVQIEYFGLAPGALLVSYDLKMTDYDREHRNDPDFRFSDESEGMQINYNNVMYHQLIKQLKEKFDWIDPLDTSRLTLEQELERNALRIEESRLQRLEYEEHSRLRNIKNEEAMLKYNEEMLIHELEMLKFQEAIAAGNNIPFPKLPEYPSLDHGLGGY
jgi:hypothetical protein